MFKKLPITNFEKSQILGFKKWFTEFKNRFNSLEIWMDLVIDFVLVKENWNGRFRTDLVIILVPNRREK
jgi:hypothetical protein